MHIGLFFVWILVSACNFTKPIHIDDAFELQTAQVILEQPLRPLSALVSIPYTTKYSQISLSKTRHPLFVPYIYAGIWSLFGYSEIALHVFLSVCSLLAIITFYLIIKDYSQKYALYFTSIFALGPGFIPSQNLMLDIPQMALWLVFLWLLLKKKYINAAAISGIAPLIKYSGLILISILALTVLHIDRWKRLVVLFIPVILLVLWSLFNIVDSGSVHLYSSTIDTIAVGGGETFPRIVIERLILWIIFTGALSPWIVMIYHNARKRLLISAVTASVYSVFIPFIFPGWPIQSSVTRILQFLFVMNGVFLLGFVVSFFRATFSLDHRSKQYSIHVILTLYVLLSFIFLFTQTPQVAVRYVFPVSVGILMMAIVRYSRIITIGQVYIATIVTVLLGVWLGLSDWQYASVYKNELPKIVASIEHLDANPNINIWTNGNLSMRWYALRSGMQEYRQISGDLQSQDYFVSPVMMLQKTILPDDQNRLFEIARIRKSWSIFTLVRPFTDYPKSMAGYYGSTYLYELPWGISTNPVEEFVIYRVH